ncbi:MAG TPA: DUF983 domain-containing protein [Caulobacteraceae bacterium]|jgi:uncharacterized protein (DUF983 family)|nr:DUF983 domain-containing protein [Caulobacteraceae bacterium]
MNSLPSTGVARAMLRGLMGRCPNCGDGAIFWRYLKVNPNCPACAQDLARFPSDDGPAYFTILITGHLVVVPLLLFPAIWKAPLILAIPGTLVPLGVFTLLFLPRVKGAVIGLLYALDVHRDEAHLHTADRFD